MVRAILSPMMGVLTIGNFDGLHLGHRAILQRAGELARRCQAKVKVITFEPHPVQILRPDTSLPRIISPRLKQQRLHEVGADELVTLKSDPKLFAMDPEPFIEKLVAEHHPVAIVEGRNFRFGRGRVGNVALLEMLGKRMGFDAIVVEPVEVVLMDQLVVTASSSLVRWLVGRGRVADAVRCLGRPFSLTGRVVAGDGRGRTIGIRTANLDPKACDDHLLPADGVYGATVSLEDGCSYQAAISIGTKPTFKAQSRIIEAHLLDFNRDIYGQTMTIYFTRWLRDQRPFSCEEILADQLHRDIAGIRRYAQQDLLEAAG